MAIVAFDHVQLAMPPGGEESARGFYRDLLGIPEVPKPEELRARGGCWFENGAVKVHLGVEADFRPSRKAHPAFLVRNLRELMGRLQEAGCETRTADLSNSTRIFTLDPFGNRIELIECTNMSL
jgi:catechol 2,3-dioxygenase-like lactoylglutathione lyase family enzyme